jgi:hypothetical protein
MTHITIAMSCCIVDIVIDRSPNILQDNCVCIDRRRDISISMQPTQTLEGSWRTRLLNAANYATLILETYATVICIRERGYWIENPAEHQPHSPFKHFY